MDLKEVFHIARSFKDYDDFKAFIDQEFNGTPTTVVDNTQYELVTLGLPPVSKNTGALHTCECNEPDAVNVKICLECDGVTH